MASVVGATFNNGKSLSRTVSAGNLVLMACVETSTAPSLPTDTGGNVWTTVTSGSDSLAFYLIASAVIQTSGTFTFSFTDPDSNNAIAVAEVSGTSVVASSAHAFVASGTLAVSVGPTSCPLGGITFLTLFSGANNFDEYASSTGSTYNFGGSARIGFAEQTGALGNYTQAGTLSGNSFGLSAVLVGFGASTSSRVGWINRNRAFVNKR